MDNKVVIRRAAADSLNIIIDLAGKVWPQTYTDILSPAQVEYMMQLFYSKASLEEQFKKDTFLIASLQDKPVGFASYAPSYSAGIYKIHKLYVLRDIQGKGLGRALVNYIIAELKSIKAIAVELNVNRYNKAKAFYEKIGFKVTREENNNIGNDYWMNDFVMRLDLM